MRIDAVVVCSSCGLETEQAVDIGAVYVLRCPCRHPDIGGVVLSELAQEMEDDEVGEDDDEWVYPIWMPGR